MIETNSHSVVRLNKRERRFAVDPPIASQQTRFAATLGPFENDWTSVAKHALLRASVSGLVTPLAAQGSPRNLRGFGRCERLFRRRFQEPAANVDNLPQEVPQVE